MGGVDAFVGDPFIGGIGLTYDTILSGWSSRRNIVSGGEALRNDISFNGAANLLFQMPDHIKDLYPFTPRIVLFGHTHEAAFQYTGGETETIYANAGTWVDSKPMTWVEVEISDAVGGGRDYTVELWFDGEASPRHAGTLNIGGQ